MVYVGDDSDDYDPDTGFWSIGNLANGESAVLTIQGTVSEPGKILSAATISDTYLRDTDLSNQSSAVLLNGGAQSDLGLAQIVDDAVPAMGDTITFSIVVSNNGVNDATGIAVADTLPQGLTCQTSEATQGAYDPGTETWTVGALAAGASATLELTVDGRRRYRSDQYGEDRAVGSNGSG